MWGAGREPDPSMASKSKITLVTSESKPQIFKKRQKGSQWLGGNERF